MNKRVRVKPARKVLEIRPAFEAGNPIWVVVRSGERWRKMPAWVSGERWRKMPAWVIGRSPLLVVELRSGLRIQVLPKRVWPRPLGRPKRERSLSAARKAINAPEPR